MSSSSGPATASRSPSPATPSDGSDGREQPMIQDEISQWYQTLEATGQPWEAQADPYLAKPEDNGMLQFDDFIEQNAYDDSPGALMYPSPTPSVPHEHIYSQTAPLAPTLAYPVAAHSPHPIVSPVKPVPHAKKREIPSAEGKVVFPDRQTCYSLPIIMPSIPEGGAKSRVETQVRVTVDLAAPTQGAALDPHNYDRVGSWKWLRLPAGTATKKRTRKQGKVDPLPVDTLHLTASVSCASPPHSSVLSCSSCQTREAKRVARKLAQRVRPTAKSDSDSNDEAGPSSSSSSRHEDTTSIIQFNCPDVLDFSTGSVILPLRITCYCRHHREKVGFHVHFTMADSLGRVIGTGTSRPIMITDDHKSIPASVKNAGVAAAAAVVAIPASPVVEESARAPSKRKGSATVKEAGGTSTAAKKRAKPYDASRKTSREASLVLDQAASVSSRPQTPLTYNIDPFLQQPTSTSSGAHFTGPSPLSIMTQPELERPQHLPTPQPSPHISVPFPTHPMTMPFMLYDQSSLPNTQQQVLPSPRIHRMIPSTGPTHGGIEVTILGANFHSTVKLSCVFGDVVASSTQRWSDNTLVCVLPPRALPGAVAVWFEGFEKEEDLAALPSSVFTYTDESDRALMELALQVVGLKMTGKIEDAKNVAMRIVGGASPDSNNNNGNNSMDTSGMMQLAVASHTSRDIRPLLLLQAGESEDFESLIVDFLSILDTPLDQPSPISVPHAISHQTSNGQTLLHLASLLGFPTLAQFLIARGADLDARDRNGFTPLHFASLSGSVDCARILVKSGADMEIVNARAKTAEEVASIGEFFEDILREHAETRSTADTASSSEEDEEAAWGDAEEDALPARRIHKKRSTRRFGSTGEPTAATFCEIAPTLPAPPPPGCDDDMKKTIDEKNTASFAADLIQRTLAQLYAAQGMIMPQLPLPHLPQLPGMPAWGAALPQIPQIPMVFPVFVPMPAWPSFLGEKRQSVGATGEAQVEGNPNVQPPVEWKQMWEKWMAFAVTMRQNAEEAPPPVYTPRETAEVPQPAVIEVIEEEVVVEDEPEGTPGPRVASRRMSLAAAACPTPPSASVEDVDAFEFRSTAKQVAKLQKKHDRMLILFWIPILLMALLYAFYTGAHFAFYALRTTMPLKGSLHGALRS